MGSLIVPVITPAGIPLENELAAVLSERYITQHGAEETTWKVKSIDGVPQVFHDSCNRLLTRISKFARGILIGGTTGEGIGLGLLQYKVLLNAMVCACPEKLEMYAGVLGGDAMVGNQIQAAQELGIKNIVLGLNHTGNNISRFQLVISALNSTTNIFLYNLPTFKPVNKDFILSCLKDERVIGFKDSSGDTEFFTWLLSLKQDRPEFQIFHGSEAGYGALSPTDLKKTSGVVAGTGNVNPQLLHSFAQNPKNLQGAHELIQLQDELAHSSGRQRDSRIPAVKVWQYIHGVKLQLAQQGILDMAQVGMYEDPKDLFSTQQSRI